MNVGKTMEMAGFCKNRSVGRCNKIQNYLNHVWNMVVSISRRTGL